jgi:thiol-disulfide isomerase/thioredoxin
MYGLLLFGCGDGGDPAEVVVGNSSPDFTLKSLDGSTVKASSLKGEVVVLNFWATYCQPCRKEIPELNEFATSSGAKVVGITLDSDGATTVRQYERETNLKLNYTVLLGNEEVFQRFNGVGIPYTLVLDKSQRIVSIHRGPVSKAMLEEDLSKIGQAASAGGAGRGLPQTGGQGGS